MSSRVATLARKIIESDHHPLSHHHVAALLRISSPADVRRLESSERLLAPVVQVYAASERFDDALRVLSLAPIATAEPYAPLLASCVRGRNEGALRESVRTLCSTCP